LGNETDSGRLGVYTTLMFPSKSRKFVHLEADQAFESLLYLLRENLGATNIETEKAEALSIKGKIGGVLGVTVKVRVLPEGGVSALDFSFSYRNLLWLILIILAVALGLSSMLSTAITMVVLVLILPLGYRTNATVRRFLDMVNEALPHLEREFARRTLMEDRKRWQMEPKDNEDLYRRLREKHTKTWGNTKVLEYKLSEYESEGLTRNEAIRKTAEEEGIY